MTRWLMVSSAMRLHASGNELQETVSGLPSSVNPAILVEILFHVDIFVGGLLCGRVRTAIEGTNSLSNLDDPCQ